MRDRGADGPVTVAAKTVTRVILDRVGLLPCARRIQRDLFSLRQNRLSPRDLLAIYEAGYHETAGYGKATASDGSASDETVKFAHAGAIIQVLQQIRKPLIGGCSSGMAVLAFRRLGLDAWGFEVSSDLDRIVIPEARAYVRRGSMTEIPFEARDGFDCLVTTDVLEHIQLKAVRSMVQEVARLKCPWMAHLINHTAMTPDHMTLKPLKWWADRFHPYYRLRCDLRAPEGADSRIYGLNGDPLHVYTFWQWTS